MSRDNLLHELQHRGLDFHDFIEQGNYIGLDAAETLSTCMVGDSLDPAKFLELLSGVVTAAANAARGSRSRVALYEECAPLLWA